MLPIDNPRGFDAIPEIREAVETALDARTPAQETHDDNINDLQKSLDNVPPLPSSRSPSPGVGRRLQDSYQAAQSLYTETYTQLDSAQPAGSPHKRKLTEAFPRPHSLTISDKMPAQAARQRVPLLNARYSVAGDDKTRRKVAKLGYGHIARESHLLSVVAAVQVLQSWIGRNPNRAIELGAHPPQMNALQGVVAQLRERSSRFLDKQMTLDLDEVTRALNALFASHETANQPLVAAVGRDLRDLIHLATPLGQTVRERVAGPDGHSLRKALGQVCPPAGWEQSAIDPAASTQNSTLAASALKAATKWGTEGFSENKSFELAP